MGAAISTHIPASVREQERHLKRERAFTSLQELYLEAILGSLIKRGFLSRKLDLVSQSTVHQLAKQLWVDLNLRKLGLLDARGGLDQ